MEDNSDLSLGLLEKGWAIRRLVDCTSDGFISYGIVQPGNKKENGVPMVRVNNFREDFIDTSEYVKVDPKIESKFKKTRLKGGEVLLTLVGSTGKCAVVPESMAGWNVARAVAVIRASEEVGATWINMCLKSADARNFLDSRANTTVQKTLNLKDVKEVPIPIPPTLARVAIERMVTCFDEKILLNRRTNETLEAMAQALFKSWFVDFDPVIDNALAAGNDIPEPLKPRAAARQASGDARKPLPEEVCREFPDAFEFRDEMGWVPQGWVVRPVGEVFKCLDRKRVPLSKNQRESKKPGAIPYYGATSVMDWIDEYIFDGIYLLVGEDGSVVRPDGSPFVQYIWGKSWVNNHAHVLQGAESVSTEHLVLYMRSQNVSAYVTGAVQMKITQSNLKSMPFLFCGSTLNEHFTDLIDGLFSKQRQLYSEVTSLQGVRDVLLPKLLSGELTLPDAERLAADVL